LGSPIEREKRAIAACSARSLRIAAARGAAALPVILSVAS
jgi:hypothetical protein